MKSITITKEDWIEGLVYADPCGCLLHRAAVREFNRPEVIVCPGYIAIGPVLEAEHYRYDVKWDDRLKLAHEDPCYLPLTIPIWPDEDHNHSAKR
jgi:hypothetical protein